MLLPFLLAGIFTTGAVLSGEGRKDNKDFFGFDRGDPNEEAKVTANTTSIFGKGQHHPRFSCDGGEDVANAHEIGNWNYTLGNTFGKHSPPPPAQGVSRGRHS